MTLLGFLFAQILLFSQIPTDNLMLHLPFNGNTVDESGNQNNAAAVGAILTSDRFGNENAAYFFDGVDDYISITNNSLNPTTNATFSFWFSPTEDLTSTSGHQIFFQSDVGGDNSGDFILSFNRTNCFSFPSTDDGKVKCELQGDFVNNNSTNCSAFGLTSVSSTTNIWTTDEWYNISVTIKGEIMNIYVNGIFESSHPTTSAFFREGQEIIMGRYFAPQSISAFSGKMDDVRVYNRALNENEIASIYEDAVPVNTVFVGLDQEDLRAFPNPTNGPLTINSTGRITVFDLTGKERLTTVSAESTRTTSLDLSRLRPGLYLVKNKGRFLRVLKY